MPEDKNTSTAYVQVISAGYGVDGQPIQQVIDMTENTDGKPIDVPSIMFGNGYDRGRKDERAAVLAALSGACGQLQDALSKVQAVMASVEKGEPTPKGT